MGHLAINFDHTIRILVPLLSEEQGLKRGWPTVCIFVSLFGPWPSQDPGPSMVIMVMDVYGYGWLIMGVVIPAAPGGLDGHSAAPLVTFK